MSARKIVTMKARYEVKNFELLKIKNRYVIFDKKTKAHYYGKKVDLEKSLRS